VDTLFPPLKVAIAEERRVLIQVARIRIVNLVSCLSHQLEIEFRIEMELEIRFGLVT
jgi:hypothetical protein